MKVAEIFPTFQGEGTHTGVPVVLVRTAGCNAVCPWCDTPRQRTLKAPWEELTPFELSMRCVDVVLENQSSLSGLYPFQIDYMLLTGGEPALQPADELAELFSSPDWRYLVETNGTLPIALEHLHVWVCVSPKPRYGPPVLPEMLERADEIKWIYEGKNSENEILELIEKEGIPQRKVRIQPLSGQLPNLAIVFALTHGFRLSFQTHKFVNWG